MSGVPMYGIPFGFDVRNRGVRTVVVLSGELDVAVTPDLRNGFIDALVPRPPDVLVDLSQATFVGSSCISVLVNACETVRAYGGNFSVRAGSQLPRLVIAAVGLSDYLGLVDPAEPVEIADTRVRRLHHTL